MPLHRSKATQDRQAHPAAPGRRVRRSVPALTALAAFGLAPVGLAPYAHADEFDWIADLLSPLLGVTDQDTGASAAGLAWLDPTVWSLASPDPSGSDVLALAADASGTAGLYEWLHETMQDWI
ncbi:hypothetical protein, partial [Mycolicibacter heraklionensis]